MIPVIPFTIFLAIIAHKFKNIVVNITVIVHIWLQTPVIIKLVE